MKVKTMSARNKTNKYKKHQASNRKTEVAQNTGNDAAVLNPTLQHAKVMIQKGDYAGAANLLATAGHDPKVRNALGVCLMRSGKIDKAVDVYRSFVLNPGSVVERREASNSSKRNFATALLMKGFPSGALAVLAEIRDPDHPMAVRLHSAIRQWEKSLSWFRRLDWKLNGIEPSHCHVPLDFEPGEFDFEVQVQRPDQPNNPCKTSVELAA